MAVFHSKYLFLLVACFLLLVNGDDVIKKATCPICEMDVKPYLNASIVGHQHVYACEMAGHLDGLQNKPEAYLGTVEKMNPADDVVYKDAKEMECPVCGKGFDELQYAVHWKPLGNQKIYTCSEGHAHKVLADPAAYVAASDAGEGFCNAGSKDAPRGSVMFNGFQFAVGDSVTCALLLFQPWILSSTVKYVFGILGVVFLASCIEGTGYLRDVTQRHFYRKYSRITTFADYTEMVSPVEDGSVLKEMQVRVVQQLPLWCKLVLAALYMVNLTIAYWLMLVIMTYEAALFMAVIVGLGLGFFVFKDTDGEKMSGNIDPCCST